MQIRLVGLLIVFTVACGLSILLAPHSVGLLDGRFQLSISSTTERFPANFLIAYCWNELEKEYAETHGAAGNEITFRQVTQTADGDVTISLPHSARHENGREVSYHEPKFIVIQFESSGQIQTKSFAIPEGRGDRELRIELD